MRTQVTHGVWHWYEAAGRRSLGQGLQPCIEPLEVQVECQAQSRFWGCVPAQPMFEFLACFDQPGGFASQRAAASPKALQVGFQMLGYALAHRQGRAGNCLGGRTVPGLGSARPEGCLAAWIQGSAAQAVQGSCRDRPASRIARAAASRKFRGSAIHFPALSKAVP